MITSENITGLILAGGAGRRLGGVDKGLLMSAGQPLVMYAARTLQPHVARLIVSANRHLERYRALGLDVQPDPWPDYRGPLAGIATAAQVAGTPYLAVVPCDMPHLPVDLVPRLAEHLQRENAPLCIARAGDRLQPLCALLRREVALGARDAVVAGHAKVQSWMLQQRAVVVEFAEFSAFINLNDHADWTDYERGGVVGEC